MTVEYELYHEVSIDREGEPTDKELAKVIVLNRDKTSEHCILCRTPWHDPKLSDATAELLSKYKGGLDLSGIGELSDSAAESLSKHQGDIELDNLGALSDAGAEFLMNHPGHLEIGDGFIGTETIQNSEAVCDLLDTFLPRGHEYRNWG